MTVELAAGTHMLLVQAPGYERVERSFVTEQPGPLQRSIVLEAKQEFSPPTSPPLVVDVPKGERPIVVYVKPAPVAEPVAPKAGGRLTWLAGGIAVAGLSAGIGLGLAAHEAARQVPAASIGQARVRARQAENLGTAAGVSFGVAGVAAAAVVILFNLEGP